MNNRLSLTDLASLLATATSKNKRDTELFLRTLIVLITRHLFQDKVVKVKGLGTFKLVQVEARESVRVQTGERFVIPAHYKFSFVPDKEIKDRVNKPFSFFEVTELNKQVDFPDLHETEEDETVESDDASVEELSLPETPDTQTVSDQPDLLEREVSSCSENSEEDRVSSVVSAPPTEANDSSVSAAPETSTSLSQEQQEPSDAGTTPHRSWMRWLLLILLAVAGIGGWRMLWQQRPTGSEQVKETIHIPASQPLDSVQSESFELPAEKGVEEQVTSTDFETLSADSVVQHSDQKEFASDSILAHVKIAVGDRLTTISLYYYGHKAFWVYLYEFNKDHIKNPNDIPIGTDIAIPAPQLYGIDAQNALSIRIAAQKQTEILSQID